VNLKRLPAFAFGLLAAATVAGFFLTAALKSSAPLVWDTPRPTPGAIDPVHGRASSCVSSSKQLLNYRMTTIPIAVSRADLVGVYIVSARNAAGSPVATISSGTPMAKSVLGTSIWHPVTFTWNGRLDDGQVAPDGIYYFKVLLEHQGRSIALSAPVEAVRVDTKPPHARVVSVRVVGTGDKKSTAPAVFSPPEGKLRIEFTPAPAGAPYRRVWIDIYRTDVAGKPQLVTKLPDKNPIGHTFIWNGEVAGEPAPAGTYLVGITAQNPACDQASWPVVLPPAPDTTPGAGMSIRYLSVTPPLTPTVSGARASVAVNSQAAFTWTLHRSGTAKQLAHGSGAAGDTHIDVPMPRHLAGLYTLVVRSGTQSAAVPLVAFKAGRAASKARVLVVLPMLTWMGSSPVDDSGDGLPDTLGAGDAVSLDRPLVDGPPASLGDDAALLSYLNSRHLTYQLTTDVALAEDEGPSLVDRWGVLFPDGEDFLPISSDPTDSLVSRLNEFVKGGGRVLALGTGTFTGTSKITGYPTDPRAGVPTKTKADPFGAERGPLTPTGDALITELTDDLHLFGNVIAFTGFSQYQPIEPPAGVHVSAAGIANGSPAIVAFPVGAGTVIEVGLPDFGTSLTNDVDSQELLDSVWHVLAKR
jgi:flagellar hook assembly protein FlgD